MKNIKVVVLLAIILTLAACKQLQELSNFAKCEFKIKSIENIILAGVNVQNVKSFSDVSLLDAAKLTSAVVQNSFPLQFTLNVDVKNPNPTQASLNKLDWILFIDDIQLLSGTSQNKIQIASNGGIKNYPLAFNFNLKDVMKEKTGQSLINFGLNLAGAGNQASRVTLKAKPYITIGNFLLPYPGYITIKNEFTSK